MEATSPAGSFKQPVVYAEGGIALKGADPVAYFTDATYVAGDAAHSYDWNGATWHFASAENRDQFASDPEKYAPQYGGYCAWAVSQGNTAAIDPNAWEIVDGKLYLNYNQKVKDRWVEDIPGNISQADQNWPQVLNN
ncbi:MAG: YHS domain-containing protein [Leptolyngbya sp. RL_3_1]|nr:YHS domain-containing protein [Leptolyngbya sp. RL_3_1]